MPEEEALEDVAPRCRRNDNVVVCGSASDLGMKSTIVERFN